MKTIDQKSILRQFIYESEEWERLLSFLKQENICYKSRLAEVVNTVEDEDIVTEAEEFNEDFLSQDRMIQFLSEELLEYNRLLKKDWLVDDEMLKNVIRHQKKMKTDIEKAEEFFLGVKKNFSGFLNSLL